MPGLRILLVDDEPEVRAVLAEYLEGVGNQVVAASSGREALRAVDTAGAPFQVALVDWQMSGISGRDVVTHLAEHSPNTPVIVCTGLSTQQFSEKHCEVQLAGVLRKPFRLSFMMRVITEAINDGPVTDHNKPS